LALLAATNEGDTVLDPFLGGGTTAVAALRTGRRCVPIEADANHISLSVARAKAESDRPPDLFTPITKM
jgi:DNA modification methylase